MQKQQFMDNQSSFGKTFKSWLPLAVAIVALTGTVYAAVQQNYRQSANDPQIQIAEDIATAVSSGAAAPDSIVAPNPNQELASTLATFVTIFSATGTPVGSSVALNGKLPELPASVFAYVKQHGQDRFTWQPQPGLRIAAVVQPFSGQQPGFVLAGRSIREIEARESGLTLIAGVGGLAALILSFLAMWLLSQSGSGRKPQPEGHYNMHHEFAGQPPHHEHEGPHNHPHPSVPPAGQPPHTPPPPRAE